MKLTNGLLLCAALIMLYGESSYAQSSAPVIVYNIDWNERLAPDLGISAHTEELLGDQIDPHTGRLSFEHVDVSLPGNSDLPVEVRRRLNPSQPTVNCCGHCAWATRDCWSVGSGFRCCFNSGK